MFLNTLNTLNWKHQALLISWDMSVGAVYSPLRLDGPNSFFSQKDLGCDCQFLGKQDEEPFSVFWGLLFIWRLTPMFLIDILMLDGVNITLAVITSQALFWYPIKTSLTNGNRGKFLKSTWMWKWTHDYQVCRNKFCYRNSTNAKERWKMQWGTGYKRSRYWGRQLDH